MEKLTVKELKVMAKEMGLAGYSKLNKEALVALLEGAANNQAPVVAPVVEEVIAEAEVVTEEVAPVVLPQGAVVTASLNSLTQIVIDPVGAPLATPVVAPLVVEPKVDVVVPVAPAVAPAVVPVAPVVAPVQKVKEEVKKATVIQYYKNMRNDKFYRVESVSKKGEVMIATLAYKELLTDKELKFTEVPYAWLSDVKHFVKVDMKEVMVTLKARTEEALKAPKAPERKKQVGPKLVVDFRYGANGYREYYVKNLDNGKVYGAKEGKNIRNLIKSYQERINGQSVSIKVEERGSIDYASYTKKATTPVATPVDCTCAMCKGEVGEKSIDFLNRNQVNLPDTLKGKNFCFACQKKLKVAELIKQAKATATK